MKLKLKNIKMIYFQNHKEKHDYNTCDVFCHKINDIIGFKHDVIGLTHDRAIYKHETIWFIHDMKGKKKFVINLSSL